MWITKDRKTFWVQGSKAEEEAITNRNRRAMFAMEKREQEYQRDLKARGFCPDCHLLLTVSHKCSKCGAIWSFHKTQH